MLMRHKLAHTLHALLFGLTTLRDITYHGKDKRSAAGRALETRECQLEIDLAATLASTEELDDLTIGAALDDGRPVWCSQQVIHDVTEAELLRLCRVVAQQLG